MNDEISGIEGLFRGFQIFYGVVVRLQEIVEKAAPSIIRGLELFGDIALLLSTMDSLAQAQIVFTDDLTLELAHRFRESSNIAEEVDTYYCENNRLIQLIDKIKNYDQLKEYTSFYQEIVTAQDQGHYQLACISLMALTDGVLADISEMQGCTNFQKRIAKIRGKLSDNVTLSQMDKKLLCVCIGLEKVCDTMFKGTPFTEAEADELNRNWLQHGRTHRTYTRLDFLKVLLLLDGIIFLSEQCQVPDTVEDE